VTAIPHLHCCVTDTNVGEVVKAAFEAVRTNTATAKQEATAKKIRAGGEFGHLLRVDGCIDVIMRMARFLNYDNQHALKLLSTGDGIWSLYSCGSWICLVVCRDLSIQGRKWLMMVA